MDLLRLMSPVFVAFIGLIGSVGTMARSSSPSPSERGVALIIFTISAAVLFVVGLKWATADENSVKDLVAGGVASILRDDDRRIDWSDWAVVVTRAGSIDLRRSRLRLRKKLFLGLISWETIERPILPTDDIVAIHHYYEVNEEGKDRRTSRYDHAVELHRADGQPIRLLDLVSNRSDDRSAALVDRLATRIKKALRRS